MNNTAFILAAGLGTRLKPLTDTMPKALVPVAGRPLLDIVRERLLDEGFDRQVVNVHHFAQQIKDHLAGSGVGISDETDLLRETGGALRHARPLFGDDEDRVLVHNVDILSNANLKALMAQSLGIDAVLLVSERQTARYLLFGDDMRLVGWTNVQTGEVRSPYRNLDVQGCVRLAFSGIHVIGRTLLDDMEQWPERFSIIDFYLDRCLDRRIYGYMQRNLRLLDVGKTGALKEAEQMLHLTTIQQE